MSLRQSQGLYGCMSEKGEKKYAEQRLHFFFIHFSFIQYIAINFCQPDHRRTDLFGCGMVSRGLGTVGMGIGMGPGRRTPTTEVLLSTQARLSRGSAGRGFWGGLGFSQS